MKKGIVELKYDPNLSIKENALKCGVTEAAVRWYIKTHNIDRRFDAQMAKYLSVQKLRQKQPDASVKQVAEELHISQNTVRKYWDIESKPSNTDSSKLSNFDMSKPSKIIKTISFRQEEILCNILRLYVNTDTFDCDLTTSIGNFYGGAVPFPPFLFDKYPQLDGVRKLDEAYSLPNGCFNSVVVDLPFIVKEEKDVKRNKMSKRFMSFPTVEELYRTNDSILELSFRLLKKKGFLIMKTMDCYYANKQHWVSNYVQNKAKEIGFELEDIFILLSKTKWLSSHGYIQHTARKYHSYFFVFKKI